MSPVTLRSADKVGPGALGRLSPAWWITSRPFIPHISVIGDIEQRVTIWVREARDGTSSS